ncbi:Outer membrane protein OmpA [Prevotella sp. tc2-28]|uniref:OmpA family protein n=1 Tax=Prevotella sp. tc2-28 TaxID=1761888 RepID=UPI00089AE242|nr:OmpA family protein [Prevotella sp. tc2-28]SEA50795.1 Outer membrane protein OmpA [Prevotella sp. tc2-28]
MKKLFLMLAAGMMAASVNAQNTAITGNKAGDNWYMGINAGLATPQQKFGDYGFFKGFAPKVGVRVGKNLTTVFGLAADADLYFLSKTDSKSLLGSKTFINGMNLDLMGTFNLSNLFAGYKGEPRCFEVIGLTGLGWSHAFGYNKMNAVNAKAALDLTFNLGAEKAWQIYIEPALVYGLQSWNSAIGTQFDGDDFKFDSRAAIFQLSVGFNYKFGNSNGTHNFAIAQLRDQAEIDGLNAKINELRADNNAKDGKIAADAATIADLQKKLADCENRPVQVVEKKEEFLQPHVIFRQGKATIDPAQYASIEMVAKYMKNHKDAKVKVLGYASPEGKVELNQKLSEQRAEVVKNALIKKYKIAADRITCEGLGATDKLSSENDFNRVAMFIDTTK